MGSKVTVQMIADAMAERLGLTRKSADAFSKAFWNVIVEGLNADGVVRIKGFGTFKLVDISSRESVNVATGERFVIQGHKRVSFVPDDAANAFFTEAVADDAAASDDAADEKDGADDSDGAGDGEDNAPDDESNVADYAMTSSETERSEMSAPAVVKHDGQVEQSETVPDASADEATVDSESVTDSVQDSEADAESGLTADSAETDASVDEQNEPLREVVEPEYEEKPADEFSGIDLIISTPESIEDAKRRLNEAKAKAERTAREAQEAMEELARQEQLVDRLVKNMAPVEAPKNVESVDGVQNGGAEEPKADDDREAAGADVAPGEGRNSRRGHKKSWTAAVAVVLAVVVAAGAVAIYMFNYGNGGRSQVPDKQEQAALKKQKEVAMARKEAARKKAAYADSIKAKHAEDSLRAVRAEFVADSLKHAEAVRKPVRPSVYVIKKGESLTKVSQKIYGTKDSVYAIIKANRFKDPDNVPVGTTVKLP